MRNALIFSFFLFLLASCSTYDYVVESDYSYRGRFNRYSSFSFANNTSFNGLLSDQQVIEKSLSSTLKAWGYDYKEKKPDIFVIYSVYFEDFSIRGYNQPDFKFWLSQNFRRNPVAVAQDTTSLDNDRDYERNGSVREDYNQKNVKLSEGTVLLSFIDRRKNQTVWQGYASGVFTQDKEKNDRVIRSAVIQILDEYKILAFQKHS